MKTRTANAELLVKAHARAFAHRIEAAIVAGNNRNRSEFDHHMAKADYHHTRGVSWERHCELFWETARQILK